MEEQLLPGMSQRGWMDAGAVRRRWKGLSQTSQGASESLWIAVALELWAQQVLDGRVKREPVRPAVVTTPAPAAIAARRGDRADTGRDRSGRRFARPVRNVRVVFCWAEASGYMAACWRALAARPGVDVHIIHPQQLFNWQKNRFHHELDGLSNEMFQPKEPHIEEWLLEAVTRQRPDAVVVCGWIYWPYTRLVRSPALRDARMILGMDSPWRGTWTQRLARFRLASTLRRCSTVVTAGERSATYARKLGVPEERIRTGYYGFDYQRFGQRRRVARELAAAVPVSRTLRAAEGSRDLGRGLRAVPRVGVRSVGTDVLRRRPGRRAARKPSRRHRYRVQAAVRAARGVPQPRRIRDGQPLRAVGRRDCRGRGDGFAVDLHHRVRRQRRPGAPVLQRPGRGAARCRRPRPRHAVGARARVGTARDGRTVSHAGRSVLSRSVGGPLAQLPAGSVG